MKNNDDDGGDTSGYGTLVGTKLCATVAWAVALA